MQGGLWEVCEDVLGGEWEGYTGGCVFKSGGLSPCRTPPPILGDVEGGGGMDAASAGIETPHQNAGRPTHPPPPPGSAVK